MRFLWTQQSVTWFENASRYTLFHQKLSQTIAPFLKSTDTLCDVGCGLGFLDTALAPHVAEITSVDVEPQVLQQLQARCRKLGVGNLTIKCADMAEALCEHDVFLMSFFGGQSRGEDCFAHCRSKLIRVVNGDNTGHLYPRQHRTTVKETTATLQAFLDQKQRQYQKIELTLEFGQPLVSEKDAKDFVRFNAPQASEQEVAAFIGQYVQHTGRLDFPLYLPNPKKIGVFIISKEKSDEHI